LKHAAIFAFVLVAIVSPAAGEDPICDPLAERLSSATPLARSLTVTFCREAAAQKWIVARDVESVQTPADFRQLLQTRAGKDLLDIGQSMFESFEKAAASLPAASGWVVRDTEHYRIFVRPDSAAARDLDVIGAEAERSRAGIAEDFALGSALATREAVISTASRPDAGRQDPSTRVAVFLYANRADDKDGHVGRNTMGSTQFGATIEAGKGRLRASIHVLYYNLFSIAVIEHEIAHVAVMLAAFDPAAIDRPLAGEKELRTAFFAGYRQLPGFLSEGVGDYGLYYVGFYKAWGLLGPPESMAAALRRGGGLPPLGPLLHGDAKLHARGHKIFSLAVSTFLRYLLQTQKPETVRDWLFAGASSDELSRRFGMSAADAERAWGAWLDK
jgi:hypothetical protein